MSTVGLTPRLRHLEILKLSFNWTDHLFKCSSLTTLIVHGLVDRRYLFHDPPSAGTMPQLLDVLGHIAPELRVLSLKEAIPSLPLGTVSSPPPDRNIVFPFLRSLHLSGVLVDTANLFNHLSPPSTVSTSITLKAKKSIGHGTSSGTAGVADIGRRLSQHIEGTLPFSSVHIKFADGTWHVACFRTADPEESPSTLVRVASSYGRHEEMPITALLRGSGNMFAHVQYLRITGDTFDLDWALLFTDLPKLQSLECDSHPFGAFFKTLSDVQTDESGGQQVPLPELRILRLVNVLFRLPADNMEQEFVDELLDWVILRCNYGFALETLELGNCAHASEIDVDLLAEVVPDVGWDGWDSDVDAVDDLILRHVISRC